MSQPSDLRPIGLFDSGVGGLTVWRELVQQLPGEDLVYFADQAHCPYGARPPAEIRDLAHRAARLLLSQDAKAIVVACNTASAAALASLRETFPEIPFIGMEPAIKPAIEGSRTGRVGVLATRGTLAGELFARTRARVAQQASVVLASGEELVERVEAGDVDSPETERLLRRYVEPLLDQGVDEIVLGCTHYPFLAPLIRKIAGDRVALVDPSPAVARQAARVIEARGLRNDPSRTALYRFITSGNPAAFASAMEKLLGLCARAEQPGDSS
jgi:glutamate racemase